MAQLQTTTEVAVQEESIVASLGINAQLFVFQLINFGIVILIVWFLILKPLTKKMEERKQKIDESLENAERVQANLKMSEQKYQEKIDEAKAKATAILRHTHEEGAQLAKKMQERAKQDVEHLIQESRKAIGKEREAMWKDLKAEVSELVVLAVGRILGKEVDEETHKQIVQKFVKEVEEAPKR